MAEVRAFLDWSPKLGRYPKHPSHADRLARTILTFFDQGQRDFGRLAGFAVKREVNASKVKIERDVHYAPILDARPLLPIDHHKYFELMPTDHLVYLRPSRDNRA
jgi:hypothetical protein